VLTDQGYYYWCEGDKACPIPRPLLVKNHWILWAFLEWDSCVNPIVDIPIPRHAKMVAAVKLSFSLNSGRMPFPNPTRAGPLSMFSRIILSVQVIDDDWIPVSFHKILRDETSKWPFVSVTELKFLKNLMVYVTPIRILTANWLIAFILQAN